ncbi:MAG: hypothetical protein WCN95_14625 [bacterium]
MARRMREITDVRQRFAGESDVTPRRRGGVRGVSGGMDSMEVLSEVCKLFCKGNTASEIVQAMRAGGMTDFRREDPYQFLSYAATRGWIRFVAPHEHSLREQIKKRCGWLEAVEVVHSSVFEDVAYQGARMLVEMLQQYRLSKKKVHIGFAGGHALRKLAWAFAQLLREPADGLPETLVFHSMVAGFDVYDPTTDPNAFFTYFLPDPAMQVKTEFVGLHAPALVRTRQFAGLRELEGIKECYTDRKELDIVVTSASIWTDPHCLLRQYTEKSKESLDVLRAAGCIGDLLWRPIAKSGPIVTETEIRAMTLVELEDLPGFIKEGKHVLLALGPCSSCGTPKGEVLEAILGMKPQLITHLVVDSLSARGLFPAL